MSKQENSPTPQNNKHPPPPPHTQTTTQQQQNETKHKNNNVQQHNNNSNNNQPTTTANETKKHNHHAASSKRADKWNPTCLVKLHENQLTWRGVSQLSQDGVTQGVQVQLPVVLLTLDLKYIITRNIPSPET